MSARVGAPTIIPLGSSVNPSGTWHVSPMTIGQKIGNVRHRYGSVPPFASSLAPYGNPIRPSGSGFGVTISGGSAIAPLGPPSPAGDTDEAGCADTTVAAPINTSQATIDRRFDGMTLLLLPLDGGQPAGNPATLRQKED